MADQPRTETPPPAAATDAARRPYTAPRLMLFGSAVEMTASGSGYLNEAGSPRWSNNCVDFGPGDYSYEQEGCGDTMVWRP